MINQKTNRSCYIDLIKFIFAVTIVLFHVSSETHVFPGGRIAVEGFFMITGFLMMKTIEKQQAPVEALGKDTVHFLWRKLSLLLPYLIPSALIALIAHACFTKMAIVPFLKNISLLLFEVIPMKTEGFVGSYFIGISWYLSSMFLALMFLYPLCRKFGSKFILSVGIPIVLMIYGYCSYKFGHIGIVEEWGEYLPFKTGSLRAIAGCLSGCILYEAVNGLSKRELTRTGNVLFILLEAIGFGSFFFILQKYPHSKFDYLLVFVLFFLLLIGLSGTSWIGRKLKGLNLRWLGTWSTLFVLNHIYWIKIAKWIVEKTGTPNLFLLFYFLLIAISSAVVWTVGKLLVLLGRKVLKALFRTAQKA